MKKTLKLIATIATCLLLVGCVETPVVYNNDNYNGEAMRIADGVYFKKVYIQGMFALLQCDKDGNITHNQNVTATYQSGKITTSTAIITPSELSDDSKFNFKCTEITDCYNQVLIVKNSLAK